MRLKARSCSFAVSVSALLITLTACAEPITAKVARSLSLNKVAEYQGKVVGPVTRGQPEDGTQFTSYELELAAPADADDHSDCGPQKVRRIPIETEEMAQYLGKRIVISGLVYCRINRTGTYHINEVKRIRVLP